MHKIGETTKALAMRTLLADDQSRVRSALHVLLSHQPGIEVVGEAAQAAELLVQAATIRPDLILLDWKLGDTQSARNSTSPYLHAEQNTGNYIMPRLRALIPNAQVIVLSGQPQVRHQALACGADAFISKMDPPDKLLHALSTCQRRWQRSRHAEHASLVR